ncbi:hypothetical protein LVY74_02220 [Acinetobacter sp. ME22]|uniref:hypothetical protein n=1 Tax=Acinetobacter sp. ME22 TaxID=2904802 RepID=UPI001EDA93D6|nr:hypothetical protein [Acinetobacter sp. ME22]MCG2572373.1 hypothetical protein [Acinetobacter sp. ME22]
MNLNDKKIVVAIENAVCEQLEASGINTDPFRLDGEKIVDVILEQLEGFVLVPKEPTGKMISAGYESKEHINNLIVNYKAMIEAAQGEEE